VCEWPWVRPHLADAFVTVNAVEWRESHFNILLNEHYGGQEVFDIAESIDKVASAYALPTRISKCLKFLRGRSS
jgi:hypothetical protein